MVEKTPIVSVCIMTYNHEKYIERALESVFSQKTELPFEIVVSDDHSTDNTLQVLSKYGSRIRLITHDENVGIARNFYDVLTSCRGDYICDLGGDDWWLSDDYIEEHYKYMKSHPECSAVAHWTKCFNAYEEEVDALSFERKMQSMEDFLWRKNDVTYHYGMIKNCFRKDGLEWLYKATRNTDEVTYIFYLFSLGKWGILPSFMYGYRSRNNEDNYNSKFGMIGNFINNKKGFDYLKKYFGKEYVFKYREAHYGANALKACFGRIVKKRDFSLYGQLIKNTSIGERLYYFVIMIILLLNNNQYPEWYKKHRKVELRE